MSTFDASIHADYILDLGEKNCSQLIMEVMLLCNAWIKAKPCSSRLTIHQRQSI